MDFDYFCNFLNIIYVHAYESNCNGVRLLLLLGFEKNYLVVILLTGLIDRQVLISLLQILDIVAVATRKKN